MCRVRKYAELSLHHRLMSLRRVAVGRAIFGFRTITALLLYASFSNRYSAPWIRSSGLVVMCAHLMIGATYPRAPLKSQLMWRTWFSQKMYFRMISICVSLVALLNASAVGGKSMCLQNVLYTLTLEVSPLTASTGLAVADAMIASSATTALLARALLWPVCARHEGSCFVRNQYFISHRVTTYSSKPSAIQELLGSSASQVASCSTWGESRRTSFVLFGTESCNTPPCRGARDAIAGPRISCRPSLSG